MYPISQVRKTYIAAGNISSRPFNIWYSQWSTSTAHTVMHNISYEYEEILLHTVTTSSIIVAEDLLESASHYWGWQRGITQNCIFTDSNLTICLFFSAHSGETGQMERPSIYLRSDNLDHDTSLKYVMYVKHGKYLWTIQYHKTIARHTGHTIVS